MSARKPFGTSRRVWQEPNRSAISFYGSTALSGLVSCRAHAVPLPCCAVPLRSRFQNGMVGARQGLGMGMGMAYVKQTRPQSVNQVGKTQSKPLATRHGRAGERQGRGMGTAWYVWIRLYLGGFTITPTHNCLGRTPLDEWAARHIGLYLATHNTHKIMMSRPRRESNPQSQQARSSRRAEARYIQLI
jgi:hypothetical protein